MDDVVVHRLGEDDFLLVINAGTREKDINWVRDNTRDFDCVVDDLSDSYTQLAIQGPRARGAAKIDGRESGADQELLVHARDGLRIAEYVDREDGLYRRRWI